MKKASHLVICYETCFQGDVGCGKTVVAFLACMEVIGSGYQVSHFILLLPEG